MRDVNLLGVLLVLNSLAVVYTTSVQSFNVQGNVVTEKGSSITLTCSVANWGTSKGVSIFHLNSVLATCYPSACVSDPGASRYTFSIDGSSIFVNIASLTRGVDDGTWRCSTGGVNIDLTITVYTSPASIEYRDAPQQTQDLSTTAVILKCVTTSCTYPAPIFTWYYKEGTGRRQQYATSGVPSNKLGGCSDSEKIHISTLTLPHNTVFPGSPTVDRTVTFECEMTFPTLTNPMFAGATPDIRFAVQVSIVTLYNGVSTPTNGQEIQVDSGVVKSLTCQTGTSRPAATIVWYIGDVKQTTAGTSFSFTPTNNDHDKPVYCKAYNIQPENQAISSDTPTLYVRIAPDIDVELSSSILKENSSLTIKCKAVGRPDAYTYTALQQTWRDTVIPNTHSHLAGTDVYSSMSLTFLQLQDTGNYTCHVNNGVRDRLGVLDHTGTVFIKVEVSPKILNQNVIIWKVLGESFNASVPFYSYPAADQVIFANQSGNPIANDSRHSVSVRSEPVMTTFYGEDVTLDGNVAILQITSIEIMDLTSYSITVTNSLGSATQTIILRGQGVPDRPVSMIIEEVAETSVVLSWKPGFHGYYGQTFVVQLSKDTKSWFKNVSIPDGQDTSRDRVNVTVGELSAATLYLIRMYSYNLIGKSPFTDVLLLFTLEHTGVAEPVHQEALSGAAIGGIVAGLVVVLVCVVLCVIVSRKYKISFERKVGNPDDRTTGRNINISAEGSTTAADSVTLDNTIDPSDQLSQYTSLTDKDITPHSYDSLQSIELEEKRPSTKVYENLKI